MKAKLVALVLVSAAVAYIAYKTSTSRGGNMDDEEDPATHDSSQGQANPLRTLRKMVEAAFDKELTPEEITSVMDALAEMPPLKTVLEALAVSHRILALGLEQRKKRDQTLDGKIDANAGTLSERITALEASTQELFFLQLRESEDAMYDTLNKKINANAGTLSERITALKASTQELFLQLRESEDAMYDTLNKKIDANAGTLSDQNVEMNGLKNLIQKFLHQTRQHTADIASLSHKTSDMQSVRNRLHILEMQTVSTKERLDGVQKKTKTMERTLDSVIQHNEEFKRQIQAFKRQVDEYQRSLRDRNPLWDALSDILNLFRDPFGSRQQKFLS